MVDLVELVVGRVVGALRVLVQAAGLVRRVVDGPHPAEAVEGEPGALGVPEAGVTGERAGDREVVLEVGVGVQGWSPSSRQGWLQSATQRAR